jgi:hypothetical protein
MARPGSEVSNQAAGFFENSTEQGLAGRRQPSYLGLVKEADDRPLLLSKGSSAPPAGPQGSSPRRLAGRFARGNAAAERSAGFSKKGC